MLLPVPSTRFSIAQVTPYGWEQHHEVNHYVERLSDELCRRGHRVVVVTPSDSRELIRESRQTIRDCERDPDSVFAGEGCAQVLAVGQSIPVGPSGRQRRVSLPVDVSRTIEDLLDHAQFDFVHVHEPFAPSASSRRPAALARAERRQLPRRHRARRLDPGGAQARRAALRPPRRAHGELRGHARPARALLPGGLPGDRAGRRPRAAARAQRDRTVEIVFSLEEERAALRFFLRALRRLPRELPWQATVWSRRPGFEPDRAARAARSATGSASSDPRRARRRSTWPGRTSWWPPRRASSPAPQLLLRAIAGGAVPVASRLPAYEEALATATAGSCSSRATWTRWPAS